VRDLRDIRGFVSNLKKFCKKFALPSAGPYPA
jgi:hypothetical protein